jgi:exosortase
MDQKSEIITGRKIGSLNQRGRWMILFSILVGLGFTIYAEALCALLICVIQRRESSHGLFVPFISGYLVWLKLDKFKGKKPRADLLTGSAMLSAGCVLFYLGRSSAGFSFPVLSFLFVAAGLILVIFGPGVFKEVGFPLFFLAAMIPLPEALYGQIAEWMRHVATWGAVTLIKPLGLPLYREGFNIYLSDIHISVEYGCSGIRYLIAYFAFSLAYAFRYKQNNKARVLVVLATVPLALIGGVLRLWMILFTVHFIGPFMAEHRPHVLLSWSVFAVLLSAAIGVDRYLSSRKIMQMKKEDKKSKRLPGYDRT